MTIEQALKESRKPLEELIVLETVNASGIALTPDGIDLATAERIPSKDKRTILLDIERSFLTMGSRAFVFRDATATKPIVARHNESRPSRIVVHTEQLQLNAIQVETGD
jgi:hypothetical protein